MYLPTRAQSWAHTRCAMTHLDKLGPDRSGCMSLSSFMRLVRGLNMLDTISWNLAGTVLDRVGCIHNTLCQPSQCKHHRRNWSMVHPGPICRLCRQAHIHTSLCPA